MDWKQQLNSLRQNLPEGNENIISETKKTNEKRQSTPVRIELDKRNGKPATIVSQIEAEDAEIEQIAKTLKIKCGAGGSVRDGEILIQGDFRQKIADLLSATGYKIRKINFSILAAVCLISLFTACKPETHDNDSEYISQVFEYMYAPGQHADSARPQDTIFFRGNPSKHEGWVYLGGFGGYIVAGFDHNIKNHAGADFEVFALSGNAPEPAVVYVMQDENNDGLPNDIWYELAGNQSNNSLHNYQLC
ncbi:MAG: translation initiation factor, partial [Paludibacter sp.]|nr:translation initiation factor [Paludibacter sp.]